VSNVSKTLKLALEVVGSPAELARALGVTPSHVSRLRKGTAGISAELSLRLSRILGRAPLRGLRDDGHAELADLIAPILGSAGDAPVAPRLPVHDDLAQLSQEDLTLVHHLIKALTRAPEQPAASRRRSARG
jgi:transcriptional regulator with XRE-family HTH domain